MAKAYTPVAVIPLSDFSQVSPRFVERNTFGNISQLAKIVDPLMYKDASHALLSGIPIECQVIPSSLERKRLPSDVPAKTPESLTAIERTIPKGGSLFANCQLAP